METLILTRGYLPHRIVDWRKAIGLWFTDKVEVVEQYDEVVRSVSLAMQVPSVVRLLGRIRHHEPRIRFSRPNLLLRDGHACQYCGTALSARDLTLDHVLPKSRGGATDWENIVAACRRCNARKGNRTPREAGMALIRAPRVPRALPFRVRQIQARPSMPSTWETWLFAV